MKGFIKIVFGTLVGLVLFNVLAVFLTIGILVGIAASAGSGNEKEEVKTNSILKVSLSGVMVERIADDPFAKFGNEPSGISSFQLKNALEKAATDPKIKGIYLETGFLMASMASLEEVRNALIEFKKSKKFIVSYGEYYTEGAYYLASTADKIYLNPGGILELNGLNSSIPFFKGAMAKLEIKPEVFRVGTFKSAVEPFILDKMSDANRLQTTSFLNSIYGHMVAQMAESRNMSPEMMRKISDSCLVQNAKDGVRLNVIDGALYWDEVEAELMKKVKVSKVDDLEFIDFDDFTGKEWEKNESSSKINTNPHK